MQSTEPGFFTRFPQLVTSHALRHLESEVKRSLQRLGVPRSAIPALPEETRTWIESHPLMPHFQSKSQGSGNLLREMGKAIGSDLIVPAISKMLPLLDNSLVLLAYRKYELMLRRNEIEMAKTKLLALRCKALLGQINPSPPRQPLWRGADVRIVPERMPSDQLPWIHEDDHQIVTGTEERARLFSNVFENAQSAMRPFLDHRSKYPFFDRMALAAINAIEHQCADSHVMSAIIDAAESFRAEHIAEFLEILEQEEILLRQISNA